MKKFVCGLVFVLGLSAGAWAGKPDIDLTKFSSVMAYSGLFNIMVNPVNYVGKVIKLRGTFDTFHDEQTGKDYFGVIISDAGACCSAGLDFVLKGQHSYPQDYPKVGQIITVSGKFCIYHEGQEVFFRLEDAEIL